MFYDFAVTVPHATAQATPLTQILPVTSGSINHIAIQFPRGTYALVHIQLLYHEHQIFPTNPEGSFNADGYPIEFDDSLPLDSEPYEIKARAWSLADTYDYDINVRIGILRPEDVEKQSGLMSSLKKFLGLVGIGG